MITRDGLLTMFNGALGGMTFGIYHQFTTNKIIEKNNNYLNTEIDLLKNNNNGKEIALLRIEMNELKKNVW